MSLSTNSDNYQVRIYLKLFGSADKWEKSPEAKWEDHEEYKKTGPRNIQMDFDVDSIQIKEMGSDRNFHYPFARNTQGFARILAATLARRKLAKAQDHYKVNSSHHLHVLGKLSPADIKNFVNKSKEANSENPLDVIYNIESLNEAVSIQKTSHNQIHFFDSLCRDKELSENWLTAFVSSNLPRRKKVSNKVEFLGIDGCNFIVKCTAIFKDIFPVINRSIRFGAGSSAIGIDDFVKRHRTHYFNPFFLPQDFISEDSNDIHTQILNKSVKCTIKSDTSQTMTSKLETVSVFRGGEKPFLIAHYLPDNVGKKIEDVQDTEPELVFEVVSLWKCDNKTISFINPVPTKEVEWIFEWNSAITKISPQVTAIGFSEAEIKKNNARQYFFKKEDLETTARMQVIWT